MKQQNFNLKDEMKEQNASLVKQFDKRLSAIDEQLVSVDSRISTIQKQMLDTVNDIKKRAEKRKRGTDKLNENKESKLNQVIDDKVSDGVSVNDNYNDMTNNNGDIIENVAVSYTHLDVYKRQVTISDPARMLI